MFKSLFARYITVFLLVVMVAFVLLAAIVNAQFADYNTRSNMERIQQTAENVQIYIQKEYVRTQAADFGTFLANEQSRIMRDINDLSFDDMAIFAVDRRGVLILRNDAMEDAAHKPMIDFSYLTELSENGGKISGMSNLNGMMTEKYMYCANSIIVGDGESVGAVFVCISQTSVNAFLDNVARTVIMAILWVMLAALIVIYFVTDRITRPLKAMSRAAQSFAVGQFDVRVPVMGNDEVSSLAVAFNHMAESLSRQEELRRTFLANVSHDLRTPMTTIGGFIDGILDGAIPPEKQSYYLQIIAQEVRRLSRLVNSLLDISRIQAGERKFTPEPFDICEMGRQILISFEQKIDRKKLDVAFICDDDNMFVTADRDAIYQVFYNLCDNAVKFAKDGGRYEISIVQTKDRKIAVSVYDEGQGISPEDLPFVFDRFYKADRSRGLDKTGTGLGLFISKTIINAHNEQIRAESEFGAWCRFTFTLPVSASSAIKKDTKND